MSALGQKQTSQYLQTNAALPPKADIAERHGHVRFVPKADIETQALRSKIVTSGISEEPA
jgi:hypothetical protein